MGDKKIIMSLRIPEELGERIDEFSKQTKRTKTSILLDAVSEYLDRYEKLLVELLKTEEKFRDKTVNTGSLFNS